MPRRREAPGSGGGTLTAGAGAVVVVDGDGDGSGDEAAAASAISRLSSESSEHAEAAPLSDAVSVSPRMDGASSRALGPAMGRRDDDAEVGRGESGVSTAGELGTAPTPAAVLLSKHAVVASAMASEEMMVTVGMVVVEAVEVVRAGGGPVVRFSSE